ncbi:MAG: peptide chain release factor-like protein [Candidatus Margulisbacteria bacterium]|nr:peptide chain release factor-like protein [Candidatus Margulisiibacteriota bacterium]
MPEQTIISITKLNKLKLRMETLGIKEQDLVEKFILGSGSGGQKVNKTASTVYLKYLPTGEEVKCGEERSRAINRFLARRILCDVIEKKILGKESKKQQDIEKIRRQKNRRSRKAKEKVLLFKRKTSEKKQNRKITNDD